MLKLILYRLVMAIPILIAVTMIAIILIGFAPGNAAFTILGSSATLEQVHELEHKLGLDLPWYEQWFRYVAGLFTGNLGDSYVNGAHVATVLGQRLPVTLWLVGLSTIGSAILGIALGTISAIRQGAWGKAVDVIAMLGLAIPGFWLALALVSLFAVDLHWLPSLGYIDPTKNLGQWMTHLILPVVALSLGGFSVIAKTTRDAVLDVQSRDFIRTLRANGVSRRSLLFKHVSKNAGVNIVTVISLTFITGLTASVFIESVFSYPGLGSEASASSLSGDIPMVEGVALYFTVLVIIVNVVIDIAYGLLNPKVRTA